MWKKTFLNLWFIGKLLPVNLILAIMAIPLRAQEQKLNIHLRNATLYEFTKAMEERSEFSFIYGEDVNMKQKISVHLENKTIEEILKFVFQDEQVDYRITGKHIILQKRTDKPVVRRYTINGYVTDRSSSETLIGATVSDIRKFRGTTTNPYGYYTITLPEGELELRYTYLGYTHKTVTWYLHKDTLLNIKLEANNVLEEVVVLSDKTESGFRATHPGAVDIPLAQIKNTPVILGETDVMKTIQSIPGVQAGVEGSAGLYVRGGSPDQNLILLDGAPVYNVDHLLGFFSVFTPEAVKKVTLFKSSFPARFGGRLSSVIDVRTNDGDMKNYHGAISIGLLCTRINAEGPLVSDKSAFSISMRRTYLDIITRPFMDKNSKIGYYFYDINTKFNHKFSDKDRLFFSLYHGNDYVDSEYKNEWENTDNRSRNKDKTDGRWGNTIVSVRWNKVISNKLFSNTTLAFNQYKLGIESISYMAYKDIENNYHTTYKSGIRDLSLTIDYDYNPLPGHHIKTGVNYMFHNFKPEIMNSKVSLLDGGIREDTLYKAHSNSEVYAHEFALYAEDDLKITSGLNVNAGLHFSGFQVQGKTYFSLQPRLAARYQLNHKVALKVSYAKMNQYINLLTSAPISMPTDLWVPVTKKIKPMNSHQYSAGVYYTGINGWELSAETYYKDMNHILEYKDGTFLSGSSTGWEEKVEMGKGRSLGIEWMARKTNGITTGWISYALAKSDRKFEKGGINDGVRFPFKYDRRHSINFLVNHKISDKIDMGASWVFMSGGTTTIAQQVIVVLSPHRDNPKITGKPLYYYDYIDGRNNYRLPASHCFNVGINFHKKKKYGTRTWNAGVYNLYNAMNPSFVHRSMIYKENKEGGEYIPVIKKFTLLPLFPSVTYTYKF